MENECYQDLEKYPKRNNKNTNPYDGVNKTPWFLTDEAGQFPTKKWNENHIKLIFKENSEHEIKGRGKTYCISLTENNIPFTNEAVDELKLKVGDQAWAVIKASDVMIAKDA